MDVLCYTDLDEFGRDLDDPIAELEQDVVHALFESWRSNPDALERSVGLVDALSGPADRTLSSRIESKLGEDDRVDGIQAKQSALANSVVGLELEIQANETALGIKLEYDAAGRVIRRPT